ncbi:MAG: hypothetical protein J7J92_00630 [Candidatus Aenigmarchaeota archaeon]|nr:hypothetical protein [Candidatus Aenigmarchaeota archaeon]
MRKKGQFSFTKAIIILVVVIALSLLILSKVRVFSRDSLNGKINLNFVELLNTPDISGSVSMSGTDAQGNSQYEYNFNVGNMELKYHGADETTVIIIFTFKGPTDKTLPIGEIKLIPNEMAEIDPPAVKFQMSLKSGIFAQAPPSFNGKINSTAGGVYVGNFSIYARIKECKETTSSVTGQTKKESKIDFDVYGRTNETSDIEQLGTISFCCSYDSYGSSNNICTDCKGNETTTQTLANLPGNGEVAISYTGICGEDIMADQGIPITYNWVDVGIDAKGGYKKSLENYKTVYIRFFKKSSCVENNGNDLSQLMGKCAADNYLGMRSFEADVKEI